MAQKELALYVAEQLAPLGEIRYIPMMGGSSGAAALYDSGRQRETV